MTPAELREQLLARGARLRQFNAWEAQPPPKLDGAAAIAGIGFLYDLIPSAYRNRIGGKQAKSRRS
ncbi:MAG: hypothetical protein SWE60_19765 [Thermodesulfobacteriota bacterium]|nr:hypothetical protein [Thermodesulfobacteriota bacterium]